MSAMTIWILLLVTFVILELISMGLTTIWFAGGVMVAMIANLLGAGIWWQILLFLSVSLVLLFFTRPIATKYFNQNRVKTNLDSLIGKQAVVTASIRNLQEEGRVMIDGKEWTARSADASRTIEKDQIVRILSIQGVKLIVEPSEENNH